MELRHKSLFILVAVIIGIGLGFLAWNFLGPVFARGVFYYQVEGSNVNLFVLKNSSGKKITSVPAREVDPGDFRSPRHSYVSHSRKNIIYFKQIGETELENSKNSEFIAMRAIYEPTLINLKTKKEKKIEQSIDSTSLIFSPDDGRIAWIKQIDEATYQDIESSGKKRELWISKIDGNDAELLYAFDENVILLKLWYGDYIYFQGLWDINNRSLGRINTKTKAVEYMVPQHCDKSLNNCKTIELSLSGGKFIYEIYSNEDGKEITELYLGDFDKKEFLELLTTDQISDRLWLDEENRFFYTEQETDKDGKIRESVHLVDIENQTDDKLFTGSYVSQLTIEPTKRYLYFLEKDNEENNDFKLMKLDLKTKETKIVLTDNYNKILLIQ